MRYATPNIDRLYPHLELLSILLCFDDTLNKSTGDLVRDGALVVGGGDTEKEKKSGHSKHNRSQNHGAHKNWFSRYIKRRFSKSSYLHQVQTYRYRCNGSPLESIGSLFIVVKAVPKRTLSRERHTGITSICTMLLPNHFHIGSCTYETVIPDSNIPVLS